MLRDVAGTPFERDETVNDQVLALDHKDSHGTHTYSHDREGRYHKRVKPCSLATETSCWWGRAQLPREWWCLVVLMEEGGTSSQLHPLHESTGTLKSQTSEDFNKSMINS